MYGLCKLAFEYTEEKEKEKENPEQQVESGAATLAAGNKLMVGGALNSPLLDEINKSKQNLAAHNVRGAGLLGLGTTAYGYGWNQIREARSDD